MKTFKEYTLLKEKRKVKKKSKKNKSIPGIYGMPLYWNSYPQGGFVEIENNENE